jgi:hypothetical protein
MRPFLRRFYNAQSAANLTVLGAILLVTFLAVHPDLVFSTTTVTGGDTASHVATPLYLREHLGSGSLTSWDSGWYDGFPLYSYYFVLPDALVAGASWIMSYAVAFKLGTLLGSFLLPICAFSMGKLFRAPNPIPAALAAATLPFLMDATYTIDGGNLFSTLAGEYSFSLSLSVALLTIGLFARGIRTGRGRWWAALALSITLGAHLLPWIFAIVIVGVLLLLELVGRSGIFDADRGVSARHHGRRATWFTISSGAISLSLSAWWLLPFITTQAYTNSMGYVNDPTSSIRAIFTKLGWFYCDPSNSLCSSSAGSHDAAGDQWVIILAAIGLIMAFFWRDRLGITLSFSAVFSMLAFIFIPQGALWNERFVPFWFISIYLLSGWLVGATLMRLAHLTIWTQAWEWMRGALSERRHDTESEWVNPSLTPSGYGDMVHRHTITGTLIAGLLGLAVTVPSLVPSVGSAVGLTAGSNQVPNWAAYNYSGYEAKPAWPEYHGVITTMKHVAARYGCGQSMWEYNGDGKTIYDENRFGSTMALMLLPYWTNNCVGSMEGLFFESTGTVAYHFLNQSELSNEGDNAMAGLNYSGLDVALGVKHLQLLGVRYYMAFTPQVIAQARVDRNLVEVAVTKRFASGVRWHIYLVRDAPTVVPLTHLPNVVNNINSRLAWLGANEGWYLNPSRWNIPYAASGPSNWPRVTLQQREKSRALPATLVSEIHQESQSISFHVSRLHVPVEVKISYYPRWHVQGADGPYRISPNLMVVIPTSHQVQLFYGSSPSVFWGNALTDIAVVALMIAAWRRRPWRRGALLRSRAPQ